jgi:hypothetical protein
MNAEDLSARLARLSTDALGILVDLKRSGLEWRAGQISMIISLVGVVRNSIDDDIRHAKNRAEASL